MWGAYQNQNDSIDAWESVRNDKTQIVLEPSSSRSSCKYVAGAGLLTMMLVGASFLGVSDKSGFTSLFDKSSSRRSSSTAATTLSVTASDEYGDTSASKFPYPFLKNALLASPYKTTTFSITDSNTDNMDCTFAWKITPIDAKDTTIDSGTSSISTFSTSLLKTVGEYELSIAQSGCVSASSGASISTTASYTTGLWVKYVRRELQSLTDSDRTAFLDAFSTLWKVNTVEGKELYGEDYKSLYYLAVVHNDGGGNSVCDEFHGDQGFVNNHMMLGAYLEQSLQLVDPSTCLHYMEYGKYFDTEEFRGHLSNQLDGGTWTEMFTEKWFGSNDPVTGRIINGRWENASVPRMTDDFFAQHGVDKDTLFFPAESAKWYKATDQAHFMNPYGLLRSPWNWNPNPFVSRFNNVNLISDISGVDASIRDFYSGVTCSDFESFLTTEVNGQPLGNFLHFAEDDIHGKIHFTFGGAGGEFADATNEILKSKYGFTDSMLILIAQGQQTFVKQAYPLYNQQSYYSIEYPFECTTFPYDPQTQTLWTTDLPGESEATCTLNSNFCQSQDMMTSFYKKFLAPFQDQSKEQYELQAMLLGMDLDQQCEVANLLVGRAAYDGEMAGSGAALDPLFWVAHGSVERLLQKIIFTGMTSDVVYDVAKNRCSGHWNEGTKAWLEGFHFVDRSIDATQLTNLDLNDFLNPNTDEYRDNFNFVYDSEEYGFCEGSESWFPTAR